MITIIHKGFDDPKVLEKSTKQSTKKNRLTQKSTQKSRFTFLSSQKSTQKINSKVKSTQKSILDFLYNAQKSELY